MAAQDNINSAYWPADDDDAVTVEPHSIDLATCPHCRKYVAAYSQRCPYCKEQIDAKAKTHRPWLFIFSALAMLTLLGAGLIGHYMGL